MYLTKRIESVKPRLVQYEPFFLNEPITSKLLLRLVLVGTGIYLVNRPVTGCEVDT